MIVDWRGWASEIINLVGYKFNIELISDVVVEEGKFGIVDNCSKIIHAASHEVIDAQNLVTLFEQSLAKMRSNESSTACNNNFHSTNYFKTI